MNTIFSQGNGFVQGEEPVAPPTEDSAGELHGADLPQTRPRVDSNSVRWVFAATVAFWLAVYAAGHFLL